MSEKLRFFKATDAAGDSFAVESAYDASDGVVYVTASPGGAFLDASQVAELIGYLADRLASHNGEGA